MGFMYKVSECEIGRVDPGLESVGCGRVCLLVRAGRGSGDSGFFLSESDETASGIFAFTSISTDALSLFGVVSTTAATDMNMSSALKKLTGCFQIRGSWCGLTAEVFTREFSYPFASRLCFYTICPNVLIQFVAGQPTIIQCREREGAENRSIPMDAWSGLVSDRNSLPAPQACRSGMDSRSRTMPER